MSEEYSAGDRRAAEASGTAEDTLRQLGRLPAPEQLTDRVHHRLGQHRLAQEVPEHRGFWSHWRPVQRLQFALAAVLAIAVAGSTWSLHRMHPKAGAVQGNPASGLAGVGTGSPSAASSQAAPPPSQGEAASGFKTAGTVRVPTSLKPIKVPPAAKRTPAMHKGAKPRAGVPAAQSATAPSTDKAGSNP